MKKLILALALLMAALCAGGCTQKMAEPVDVERLTADLPEELSTLTIDGEAWPVQETTLEIQQRNTDLDHQTDDVSCLVELTGEGFLLRYPCELHYAYLRSSGWELRSYDLTGEPELTLEESACMDAITRVNQAKLLEELDYDTVELLFEDWDKTQDSYRQTYSVAKETEYLTESGTVEVSGALSRESGFSYAWQSSTGQVTTETQVKLLGTVWHFSSQEQRAEAAFQVTEQSGATLTLTGVLRGENWAGNIKEKALETQVDWTVSEFGCITFELPEISAQEVECNIQSDRQWVNLDGLYLGDLESAAMPESGNLSDLMELDTESWLDNLMPQESEQPEEPETQTEPEEQPESTSPVESILQEVGNLLDYITGLFGF